MALASDSRAIATSVSIPRYADLGRAPFPFLIDWTERWTILGSDPVRVLVAQGERLTEWREGRVRAWVGDPFTALEEALKEHAVEPTGLPFAGAAVGYLGYDLGGRLEKLPRLARDDRGFPDVVLAFHDRAVVVDRANGTAQSIEVGPRDAARAISPGDYEKHFGAPPPLPPWTADRPVVSNFTRAEYLAAIERAREYIAAGDIYQVNLSQRFHTRSARTPGSERAAGTPLRARGRRGRALPAARSTPRDREDRAPRRAPS